MIVLLFRSGKALPALDAGYLEPSGGKAVSFVVVEVEALCAHARWPRL